MASYFDQVGNSVAKKEASGEIKNPFSGITDGISKLNDMANNASKEDWDKAKQNTTKTDMNTVESKNEANAVEDYNASTTKEQAKKEFGKNALHTGLQGAGVAGIALAPEAGAGAGLAKATGDAGLLAGGAKASKGLLGGAGKTAGKAGSKVGDMLKGLGTVASAVSGAGDSVRKEAGTFQATDKGVIK